MPPTDTSKQPSEMARNAARLMVTINPASTDDIAAIIDSAFAETAGKHADLLEAAKNAGGGDMWIAEYGRTCSCAFGESKRANASTMGNYGNHSTACNDLWDAISKAQGK